jgi:hypothetical protein
LISSNILIENLLGNKGSHSVNVVTSQVDNVCSLVPSATAGKLTISQSSHVHSLVLSCKYQHRSLSCNLCMIIIIASVLGLLSLEVTVFSYQLLIQILFKSLSTSSGLSGSSIINIFAHLQVIDQPEPVE